MSKTVTGFEPAAALFVPSENPLVFYEAITELAQKHLRKNGTLWFEANETRAEDVAALLRIKKFVNVKVHVDMSRKKRFVSGRKS